MNRHILIAGGCLFTCFLDDKSAESCSNSAVESTYAFRLEMLPSAYCHLPGLGLQVNALHFMHAFCQCLMECPNLECRPSWNLAGVVAIICTGLIMLVAGETQFNLVGFVLVMTASMLSGLRWTITQVLLQGTDAHGRLFFPVTLQLSEMQDLTSLTCMVISRNQHAKQKILWYRAGQSVLFC